MKRYIVYIILIVLMFASFFVSGLFFVSSGLVDFETGVDNEGSIRILAKLDTLPFITIDPYQIDFYLRGKVLDLDNESIRLVSYHGKEDVFYYGNSSFFDVDDELIVIYNYLPEGGKKIVRIRFE